MQPLKKRIEMFQVIVPHETRMKLLHDRNEVVGCGPAFCKQCGNFFDESRIICDYASCTQHKGKKGFKLVDIL